MKQIKNIILASASPRRKNLLEQIGLQFQIRASRADETLIPGAPPGLMAEELAARKAREIAEEIAAEKEKSIVIGADTIVVCDEEVLIKPTHEEDARRMLRLLRNRQHEVFTGVCIINTSTGKYKSGHRRTIVSMRGFSDMELDAYIQSGEPFDKAGSYGIQGMGALLIESIEGDYYNVVGLPLTLTANLLAEFGIRVLT